MNNYPDAASYLNEYCPKTVDFKNGIVTTRIPQFRGEIRPDNTNCIVIEQIYNNTGKEISVFKPGNDPYVLPVNILASVPSDNPHILIERFILKGSLHKLPGSAKYDPVGINRVNRAVNNNINDINTERLMIYIDAKTISDSPIYMHELGWAFSKPDHEELMVNSGKMKMSSSMEILHKYITNMDEKEMWSPIRMIGNNHNAINTIYTILNGQVVPIVCENQTNLPEGIKVIIKNDFTHSFEVDDFDFTDNKLHKVSKLDNEWVFCTNKTVLQKYLREGFVNVEKRYTEVELHEYADQKVSELSATNSDLQEKLRLAEEEKRALADKLRVADSKLSVMKSERDDLINDATKNHEIQMMDMKRQLAESAAETANRKQAHEADIERHKAQTERIKTESAIETHRLKTSETNAKLILTAIPAAMAGIFALQKMSGSAAAVSTLASSAASLSGGTSVVSAIAGSTAAPFVIAAGAGGLLVLSESSRDYARDRCNDILSLARDVKDTISDGISSIFDHVRYALL